MGVTSGYIWLQQMLGVESEQLNSTLGERRVVGLEWHLHFWAEDLGSVAHYLVGSLRSVSYFLGGRFGKHILFFGRQIWAAWLTFWAAVGRRPSCSSYTPSVPWGDCAARRRTCGTRGHSGHRTSSYPTMSRSNYRSHNIILSYKVKGKLKVT